jgi:hypothetical protein
MYTIERVAWSIEKHCYLRFRLTYSHSYLADRGVWRDFLVGCEELGTA